MKVDGKIGAVQAVMVIMLTVGITNHVTVIPLLLSKAGRDSWISVLLTGIPFVIWAGQLFAPHAGMGDVFGTDPILRDRRPSGDSPSGHYVGAAAAGCDHTRFFCALGNTPKKDYSMLFPLFQHGTAPAIHGMVYAAGGFVELFVLLLIQHHVRTPLRLVHDLVLVVIVVILTLSPLTGAIAEFGPIESSRQRFPAFGQWRGNLVPERRQGVETIRARPLTNLDGQCPG